MKNQDDKLNILFCSRLVLEKGVDILLDVIEQSLADPFLTDKIIWHIASDGDSSYEVENISLKSKGKVIYYGKISQLELAELMRASDLLFMPSRFLETF
jgi:glycosyltransferase involved in cell wall biosynthesis